MDKTAVSPVCRETPGHVKMILFPYYRRGQKQFCKDQNGNKWIMEIINGTHKISRP